MACTVNYCPHASRTLAQRNSCSYTIGSCIVCSQLRLASTSTHDSIRRVVRSRTPNGKARVSKVSQSHALCKVLYSKRDPSSHAFWSLVCESVPSLLSLVMAPTQNRPSMAALYLQAAADFTWTGLRNVHHVCARECHRPQLQTPNSSARIRLAFSTPAQQRHPHRSHSRPHHH